MLSNGTVLEASGRRLLLLADVPPSGVAEVRTEEHGVLARADTPPPAAGDDAPGRAHELATGLGARL